MLREHLCVSMCVRESVGQTLLTTTHVTYLEMNEPCQEKHQSSERIDTRYAQHIF